MTECCHVLKYVIDIALFPIRYYPTLKQYRLIRGIEEDGVYCNLRYCPFCGHQFPKPAGPGIIDFDKNTEAVDLLTLSQSITSVEVMHAVLGSPDRVVTSQCSQHARLDPWIRQYQYWSLWTSCRLTVSEYSDGTLSHALAAKSAGDKKGTGKASVKAGGE